MTQYVLHAVSAKWLVLRGAINLLARLVQPITIYTNKMSTKVNARKASEAEQSSKASKKSKKEEVAKVRRGKGMVH